MVALIWSFMLESCTYLEVYYTKNLAEQLFFMIYSSPNLFLIYLKLHVHVIVYSSLFLHKNWNLMFLLFIQFSQTTQFARFFKVKFMTP